jgi:Phosphoserine phosphatase RsbU, N-terminal domain
VIVTQETIASRYESELCRYLSGEGEIALEQAYELGREASVAGIDTLEVASLHHDVLCKLLGDGPVAPDGPREGHLRSANVPHRGAVAFRDGSQRIHRRQRLPGPAQREAGSPS